MIQFVIGCVVGACIGAIITIGVVMRRDMKHAEARMAELTRRSGGNTAT